MDAMTSSPTVQSATKNASVSGKGTSKGTTSTDSFSELLAGQTSLGSAASEGQPTDVELSMSMMLQMLQTLVNPVQPIAQQEASNQLDGENPPELLIEVMNSNPALVETLLQDPKLKKWFENADELLGAVGGSSFNAVKMPFLMQQPTNESLKVQNTLLSLMTLSKQHPDNSILKFLQADLANTLEPVLPEILAVSKNSQLVNVQVSQMKQDRFALKNVPAVILDPTTQLGEDLILPLVDLPIEADMSPAPIVTIGDLQKLQQASMSVEKNTPPVITAENFTEEMTSHVLKNMKITISEGFSEAKLSLFPKNLGHIDVKISMHGDQLFAQFAADSLAGKQILESQLPQLRQALLAQGLQVEKLEVTQSHHMFSGMSQEQRQSQAFNQSNRQSKNRSNSIDVEAHEFNEDVEKFAQSQGQAIANGSSLDVTA